MKVYGIKSTAGMYDTYSEIILPSLYKTSQAAEAEIAKLEQKQAEHKANLDDEFDLQYYLYEEEADFTIVHFELED